MYESRNLRLVTMFENLSKKSHLTFRLKKSSNSVFPKNGTIYRFSRNLCISLNFFRKKFDETFNFVFLSVVLKLVETSRKFWDHLNVVFFPLFSETIFSHNVVSLVKTFTFFKKKKLYKRRLDLKVTLVSDL